MNRLDQLEVRAMSLAGVPQYGVVSTSDIARGEFVAEYVGEMSLRRKSTSHYIAETSISGTPYYINARDHGNITRFIKHSCQPNLFLSR